MVKGDEMATFLDLMGEVLVHEHLFYEVSRELDWETLARLDVKFWAWFWPWYEEVNRMWSFVNLAGTIEVDHEKQWDWLKTQTKSIDETLTDPWTEADDSDQWSHDNWSQYWRTYNAAKYTPETFMFGEKDPETIETVCSAGSFLDKESGMCQPCHPGCLVCESLGRCLACYPKVGDYEAVTGLDFGFCFPRCFQGMTRQTVYFDQSDLLYQLNAIDPQSADNTLSNPDSDQMDILVPAHLMMQTCRSCDDPNCRGCLSAANGAQFCYECHKGYTFDPNDHSCRQQEDAGEQKINIRFNKDSIVQCDTVKVILDTGGDDRTDDLVWAIEIESMEANEELIAHRQWIEQKAAGKTTFDLDSKFTSMLQIGAQVQVIAQTQDANNNDGMTVLTTKAIKVEYLPQVSLSYDKTIQIMAEEGGFSLNISKWYPKCPHPENTIQNLSAKELDKLSIQLLSLDREVIADLSDQKIPEQLLKTGQTYLLKIEEAWITEVSTYSLVQVEPAQAPFCFFEEGDLKLVDPSEPYTLKPKANVQISQTSWECKVIKGQDSACPEEFFSSPDEPEAIKVLPAGYIPWESILSFTFTFQSKQAAGSTSCTIELESNERSASDTISLEIFGDTSPARYLNPQEPNQLICRPTIDSSKLAYSTDMKYEFWIEKFVENRSSPGTALSKINRQILDIQPKFLDSNEEYTVNCRATNTEQTITGLVQMRVNTFDIARIKFLASPTEGIPFKTYFKLQVEKPEYQALKCVFGYHNPLGEVLIIDDGDRMGQGSHSSQTQTVWTRLPSPENLAYSQLRVFTRCQDAQGREKTEEVLINLQADPEVSIYSVDSLAQSISNGESRVSDIITFTELVTDVSEKSMQRIETKRQKQAIKELLTAIQSVQADSQQNSDQLTYALYKTILRISIDSSLSQDTGVIQEAIKATENHLFNQKMTGESFQTYTAIIDSLIELTGGSDAISRLLEYLLSEGVDSLASSMWTGVDELSQSTFESNQFKLQIRKVAREEIETWHALQMSHIYIPYGDSFTGYRDIVFALQIDKAQDERDDEFLSQKIRLSARALLDRHPGYSELEIKGLKKPIRIQIPLTERVNKLRDAQCIYFDEQEDQWAELVDQTCDEAKVIDISKMTCCANLFSTFAVRKSKGSYHSVEDQYFFEWNADLMIFILAVNLLLLLFAIIGCRLDQTQKWIQEPPLANAASNDLANVNANEPQASHTRVPSSSIHLREPGGLGRMAIEMQQSAQLPKQNLSVIQQTADISRYHTEFYGDNSNSQTAQDIVVNPTEVELEPKQPTQEQRDERGTKDLKFGRLVFNSFKFYGRIAAVFLSHNVDVKRALTALSLTTQIMLVATIVCLLEDNGSIILIAFLLMRILQFILGLLLTRDGNTSKSYICITELVLFIIYIVATMVVFSLQSQRGEQDDEGAKVTEGDTLTCLFIEFILWDLLLMPLCLASLAFCCRKRRGFFKHFRALTVV